MSIALRDTATSASGSPETDCLIPATVQTGDQLLAFWTTAATATPATPAGWTLLGNAQGSSTNHDVYAFSRTAQSGDAGSSVPFVQGFGTGTISCAIIAAYYDSAGGTVGVDGSSFGTNTLTMPALTTVADQCVTIGAACVRDSTSAASITWTDPSGFTNAANKYLAGGSGKSLELAHNLTPVAAGSNVGGGVFTTSSTSANKAALTIALKVTSAPPDIPSGSVSGRVSWTSGPAPTVAGLRSPAFAAHRGGLGEGPAETMAAYNQSMPLGLWLLAECDCQANADGSIVLWHDDTIDGSALVADQTDADWDALTVDWPSGHSGVPSPAPAAYWSQLADQWGGKRILIPEMKDSGAVDSLLQADIIARGLVESTIIQCFDYTRAKAAAANGFHVMYLVSTTPPDFADVASHGIEFVGMSSTGTNITSDVCDDAHAAGITLWAYTVNSTTARDTLLAAGCDGFFTNFPTAVAASSYIAGGVTGHADHYGTTAAGITWTASVTGRTKHSGSVAGTVQWAGAASGRAAHAGTTAGGAQWTGELSGRTKHSGSIDGGVQWVGAISGTAPDVDHKHGQVTGLVQWTGTVTGRTKHSGTVTATVHWAGTASGRATHAGQVAGATQWTGAVSGRAKHSGSVAGSLHWTAAISGRSTVHPTPAARTRTVPPEHRIRTVSPENRTVTA